MVQPEQTRVSGRRLIAHLADGVLITLILFVVGVPAARTLPLYIEYVYVIALIGMLSSERRQRFGDRWARTYVVDA